MESVEDYYDDTLKKATQEFTSPINPMYGHTKAVQQQKPSSNVQARAAAINQQSTTGVIPATRRPSITTQTVQQQFPKTPNTSAQQQSSTKPVSQQYSQNVKDTASNVVSSSTEPSVVFLQRNTILNKSDINEIVDSIGLLENKLYENQLKKEIIANAYKIVREENYKTQSKKYLINFVGHPAIQYYILQKEKLYFEEIKKNRESGYKDIDNLTKANLKTIARISEEIATLIIKQKIGQQEIKPNVIDNNIFYGSVKPNYLSPYLTINFKDIEVSMELENTCINKKKLRSEQQTRRYFKGGRKTKRRFN